MELTSLGFPDPVAARPYLGNFGFILLFGGLKRLIVVPGTVIVHQLPPPLGNARLWSREAEGSVGPGAKIPRWGPEKGRQEKHSRPEVAYLGPGSYLGPDFNLATEPSGGKKLTLQGTLSSLCHPLCHPIPWQQGFTCQNALARTI